MTRKYYGCGSAVYQIVDDSGMCYLYKMKAPLDIVSEWRAWDFVSRYSSFDEAFHALMDRTSIRNEDKLKGFEISEDRVTTMINGYKSAN